MREKTKMEDDRFDAHLLDPGLNIQNVAIAAGPDKFAMGLDDGQAKAFLNIAEDFLGRQTQRSEEFLNGSVAITEIAGEINDAVRVGIPKADPHLSAVAIGFPTHVQPRWWIMMINVS